jgi:hypothetical protein
MKWVAAENLEVCDDWGCYTEVLYKVQRTETGVRIGRIGSGSNSMSTLLAVPEASLGTWIPGKFGFAQRNFTRQCNVLGIL